MTKTSKDLGPEDETCDTSVNAPIGAPPLLPTENPADYQAFHQKVVQVIKPVEFIEELWASDFTKLYWHEMRLERLKIEYLQAIAHLGLDRLLEPQVHIVQRQKLISLWVKRDAKAVKLVEDMLTQSGLTLEAISAQTLMLKLEEFERIEKLIETIAIRRNRVLHEIELRRELFARRLQEAANAEKTRLLTSPDQELREAAE